MGMFATVANTLPVRLYRRLEGVEQGRKNREEIGQGGRCPPNPNQILTLFPDLITFMLVRVQVNPWQGLRLTLGQGDKPDVPLTR